MTRIGFYSGSFDPLTNGHMDVIARALTLVDELVVGIGVHHGKTPMFEASERQAMIEAEAGPIAARKGARLRVVTFSGLVVEAAAEHNAAIVVRGLRDGTDFDYEMQMSGMNAALAPAIETVFLPGSPGVRHISASLVRQIAKMGGDVGSFVPPDVARRLAAKGSKGG